MHGSQQNALIQGRTVEEGESISTAGALLTVIDKEGYGHMPLSNLTNPCLQKYWKRKDPSTKREK